MSNILIIENQVTQFEKLRGRLILDGHKIYPHYPPRDPDGVNRSRYDDSEYNFFMERVMIFLNNNYRKHRSNAGTVIENYIRDKNIDLFIIDFKLSGSWEGLNGTDLANLLMHSDRFPDTPIIFLSRTPKNLIALEKNKNLVGKKFEWVEKGYSGESLWDENYFDLYIRKTIEKMLPAKQERTQSNEHARYTKNIEELLCRKTIGQKQKLVDFLKYLEKNPSFDDEVRILIDTLIKETDLSPWGINKCITRTNTYKVFKKNKNKK